MAYLVIAIAVFIAFSITTDALRSNSSQLISIGIPLAYYKCDSVDCSLSRLLVILHNPSSSDVCINELVVEGSILTLRRSAYIKPRTSCILSIADNVLSIHCLRETYSILLSDSISNVNITSAVSRGYVSLVLISNTGVISTMLLLVEAKAS